MEPNPQYKAFRATLRWVVFLFVILPLLPVAAAAFILGMVWALSKECFLGGASVLSVWDDYESKAQ